MNIYVGNLSYEVNEDDLRETFETYGQVSSSTIIKDKFSGKSKGFGFVEMSESDSAKRAIDSLNGTDYKGRTIKVNEALPRQDRGGMRGPRTGGFGRRD